MSNWHSLGISGFLMIITIAGLAAYVEAQKGIKTWEASSTNSDGRLTFKHHTIENVKDTLFPFRRNHNVAQKRSRYHHRGKPITRYDFYDRSQGIGNDDRGWNDGPDNPEQDDADKVPPLYDDREIEKYEKPPDLSTMRHVMSSLEKDVALNNAMNGDNMFNNEHKERHWHDDGDAKEEDNRHRGEEEDRGVFAGVDDNKDREHEYANTSHESKHEDHMMRNDNENEASQYNNDHKQYHEEFHYDETEGNKEDIHRPRHEDMHGDNDEDNHKNYHGDVHHEADVNDNDGRPNEDNMHHDSKSNNEKYGGEGYMHDNRRPMQPHHNEVDHFIQHTDSENWPSHHDDDLDGRQHSNTGPENHMDHTEAMNHMHQDNNKAPPFDNGNFAPWFGKHDEDNTLQLKLGSSMKTLPHEGPERGGGLWGNQKGEGEQDGRVGNFEMRPNTFDMRTKGHDNKQQSNKSPAEHASKSERPQENHDMQQSTTSPPRYVNLPEKEKIIDNVQVSRASENSPSVQKAPIRNTGNWPIGDEAPYMHENSTDVSNATSHSTLGQKVTVNGTALNPKIITSLENISKQNNGVVVKFGVVDDKQVLSIAPNKKTIENERKMKVQMETENRAMQDLEKKTLLNNKANNILDTNVEATNGRELSRSRKRSKKKRKMQKRKLLTKQKIKDNARSKSGFRKSKTKIPTAHLKRKLSKSLKSTKTDRKLSEKKDKSLSNAVKAFHKLKHKVLPLAGKHEEIFHADKHAEGKNRKTKQRNDLGSDLGAVHSHPAISDCEACHSSPDELLEKANAYRQRAEEFEGKAKELENHAEVQDHQHGAASQYHEGPERGGHTFGGHDCEEREGAEGHYGGGIDGHHQENSQWSPWHGSSQFEGWHHEFRSDHGHEDEKGNEHGGGGNHHVQVIHYNTGYPYYHSQESNHLPLVEYHKPHPPTHGLNPYEVLTTEQLHRIGLTAGHGNLPCYAAGHQRTIKTAVKDSTASHMQPVHQSTEAKYPSDDLNYGNKITNVLKSEYIDQFLSK
eukprot:gene16641-18331_t